MDVAKAEQWAEQFHWFYERLAPLYGYKTREASAVPWDQVPITNRQLMIRVAWEVGSQIEAAATAPLVEALRRAHDPHDEHCASWPQYDRPCDCGVDAILARHAAAEGDGKK